jgi:4a-hydroxytetrahydrobiopterin dehydratase
MNQQWHERNRPLRLERRFEFADYDELRDFLDQAADLSESEGFYPDMGFGRDYVSITIHAEEGSAIIESDKRAFAEQLGKLSEGLAQSGN